ncbi:MULTISPECIES: hypothetical protein [unclassified Paenibacillus]|uniref:hypothetical protein n=1 Tax=unclassified Paenibacillus TaxID=185978 RepID=UPI0009550055|nr:MULTISPECIES: hypothetical protein [unclassified Paenibacillus]ASS67784.1 hypothetical protein CIC07_17765 [Paenibacillus sp. RUD330]SIR60829.1 hypothetical protein SAMN05880555_4419 [Paenibacillus sp. RU4X]SIR69556.1 hypothetical protein SAMN05880570_4421 [Paenibacillus sp. RU4T]
MKTAFLKLMAIAAIALFAVQGQGSASAAKDPIPMLQSLSQVSDNQIQITYDRSVDVVKGMQPSNYWVQSTTDAAPSGIATLGKDDKVMPDNALTGSQVSINPVDGQNKSFVLTFSQAIPKGQSYKLIICFVTVPGGAPYSGDNGMAVFTGK